MSSRRRLLISCALAVLSLPLPGCGEQWRILRILVNPAPIAGEETVQAVHLRAGSFQSVLIETVFERFPGYSGLIQWQAKFTRQIEGRWVASYTGFSNVPPSNHGNAAPIFASCSRVQDASGTSVRLSVMPSSGFDVSMGPGDTVTGPGSTSSQYVVDIVSTDRSGSWVSARAAKPLDITCVDSPPVPTCGGPGQACCASGPSCNAGLACTGGSCSVVSCGSIGEPCCSGNTCSAGNTCASSGVCVACPAGPRQLVDTTAHNGADCGGTSHDYFFGPEACDPGFVIGTCSATLSSQANGSTCSAMPAGGCRCQVHVTTPADCFKWADCHVVVSEKPAAGCP